MEDDVKKVKELIKKAQKQIERERKNAEHLGVIQAGKDLVLLCLWLNAMGANVQGELPAYFAKTFYKHPEALKEVLAYYDVMKEKNVKGLLAGFTINISGTASEGGKLWVNFFWHKDKETTLFRGDR